MRSSSNKQSIILKILNSKKMNEEQIKALQEAFEAKIKEAASKEEIAKMAKEFAEKFEAIKVGATEEQIKAIQDDYNEKLKAQWIEVEKQLKANQKVEKLSWGDKLKAAFVSKGLIEVDAEGNELLKFNLEDTNKKEHVKVAFDMNTAGTTASVATGYQTNYGMMRQELLMSPDIEMLDIFPHMPLAAIERYMAKVIEYEETDGSGQKSETTVAGDSSFKLKTEDFKVFDYAVKFRVHKNMLRTWTYLQGRIQAIGMDRLKAKISRFVIDASAAGNGSTVPYGMLSTAKFTAYDLTLRAGEVKAANIVNVIKNAVLQSEIAQKPVNAIFLNPVDIATIEDLKDANDNSVRLAGLVVGATGKLEYIYGLRVLRNSKVTSNTAILVNTNEAVEFGDKFNLETIIGYDQTTDFSKGIVTIQLETELAIGLGDPLTIIYISDITAAAAALSVISA